MLKSKKTLCIFILIAVLLSVFIACGGNENITFTAIVDSAAENSLTVNTINYDGFDKATVGITEKTVFEDITLADIKPGDTLEITILSEIRESYPVQVTAVKIKKSNETANP